MAGLHLGCVRSDSGLCAELPWRWRQAASLNQRGLLTTLAAGWAGVVLLRGRWKAEGGASEKRRKPGNCRAALALRVLPWDSSEQQCALCRNARRAAVSDQRGGGDGAEHAG